MSASRYCCRANLAIEAELQPTIVRSSKRCCGSPAQVAHGAICRRSLAAGTVCTSASADGRLPGYGTRYLLGWPPMRMSRKSSSIAPLCALISTRLGRPKKGDQALGRSRGGLGTKIHALVDGLGMLAKFRLTGGQAGDSPEALPLLDDVKPGSVAADKAYDTDALIEHLQTLNVQAVIPSRTHRLVQRPLDKHLYRSRNLVERFFCRIKQFRRVATRYDKLSERFASFVALAAAFIWLV